MDGSNPRVLIFSASIGEGHDGPARQLAAGVAARHPGARIETVDFLGLVSLVRAVALRGSSFHSRIGSASFDLIFWLVTEVGPARRLLNRALVALTGRRMLREVAAFGPDVVVSTYPGSTQVLGDLRAAGRLQIPVVSAITDLAALRHWAHPGVDLHLITHPESEPEVRAVAPASQIRCVRGLTSPSLDQEVTQSEAKALLGLPAEAPVIAVSGGGWAVGDLGGAVAVALAVPDARVICLCGRNEQVRERIQARFAGEERLRVVGFTERIGEIFAAADVLVHSTAGLTVLEALICGCRVVSYGWGHGHVRVNNRAFADHGLAQVARRPDELRSALARALAAPRVADHSFAERPAAASVVTELAAA